MGLAGRAGKTLTCISCFFLWNFTCCIQISWFFCSDEKMFSRIERNYNTKRNTESRETGFGLCLWLFCCVVHLATMWSVYGWGDTRGWFRSRVVGFGVLQNWVFRVCKSRSHVLINKRPRFRHFDVQHSNQALSIRIRRFFESFSTRQCRKIPRLQWIKP